jgi:hypothetical protein
MGFVPPDKPDSSSQEFLTDADATAIYNTSISIVRIDSEPSLKGESHVA